MYHGEEVIIIDVGKPKGLGIVGKHCVAGQDSQKSPPQLKYFTIFTY